MNEIDTTFENNLRALLEEETRDCQAAKRMEFYIGASLLMAALLVGYALGYVHERYVHQHDFGEGFRLGRTQGWKDASLCKPGTLSVITPSWQEHYLACQVPLENIVPKR